jgi:hypothetical protein
MTLRILSSDEYIWTLAPQGRLDLPAARALEDALNDCVTKAARAWSST